jgi:hypothetical protein
VAKLSLYNNIRTLLSLPAAARLNGTVNGAAVNTNIGLANFRTAMLVVIAGTITDGSHAVTVEDSVNGSTGWVAVPAGALQGALPTVVAANDDVVFEVGISPDPTRPFLRAVAVTTGATTGGIFGAVIVLGQPASTPVSHA